ncbi:ribbon-helix-helix protein, CopG family [Mangrovibacterium sp.]|uniref:ribbon-helix-helix protein, CopG family n=1 Tax=Mangrovibacterium sp. TaxID=1961364 RepID=UPI003561F57E
MTFKIPKKTHKTKLLGFKASPEEVKKLKQFCEKEQVSQSELIRFAIRLVIPNF